MELENNIRISKTISAIVIILSAIVFPVYFLLGEELSTPSPMQWSLIALYTLIVIGFTLLAFGVKIKNITSEETDNKIKEKKVAFDKAAKPYFVFIFIAIFILLTYTVFILQSNA